MSEAQRQPGDVVTIPGLNEPYVVRAEKHGGMNVCDCPVCGGIGYLWAGWFSCDDCPAIAVLETGETFTPAAADKEPR